MPTFFKPDTSSYPGIRWPSTAVFDAIGVELEPADIRSLNSSPITIVAGEDNVFLSPGQCVFIGAQGSGAYSAAPQPALEYSDGSVSTNLDATSSWDGSASAFSVVPDVLINASASVQNLLAKVGLSLRLNSGGDVIGGDAPCTIILFFTRYNLAGRL